MDGSVIRGRGTATEFALSQQAVYDLLSSGRRRQTVECLLREDETTTVGELATRVAALENDVPVETVTRDQRRRVYTALRQFHLPKLDSAGVVEFDPDDGAVEPTPAAKELRPYVVEDPRASPPWWSVNLTAAAAGGGVLLLETAGVPPFVAVPETTVALAVVGLVGTVALVQAALNRPSAPVGLRLP